MVTKRFPGMMKFFLLATVLSMTIAACDNKDDDNNTPVKSKFTLSANANAAQETPATTSTATGTLTGTYDSVTNLLTFQANWTGLTGPVTAMHFHGPAAAGTPAAVALGMPGWPAAAAGSHSGTLTVTQLQEPDLLAGLWYWNIHTAANGGGEIRGQVTVQ